MSDIERFRKHRDNQMEEDRGMSVASIFPANDFDTVLESARGELECGLVIGYNKDGFLTSFGGGMSGGRQPTAAFWLYMLKQFEIDLMNGVYSDE
ncbi:MAG: hypothetical protein GY755_18520 [Chloroflexi bacterium]|nr:hypothetical protein [Chloroflexota bacterium]